MGTGGGRLSFIQPLMPTLVQKPPERDGWLHEVKFDGDRSQIVRDSGGVRIFTRRGLDWTSKYRDLAKAAGALNVESAIIDGEVIVINEAGLPYIKALRVPSQGASMTSILSPSICFTSTATTSATCR
jgi:ATP-dependent DNA ligase